MTSRLVSDHPVLAAYSPSTLAALRAEAGLVSDVPLSRDDVLSGAAADAEAIFSSWGMPTLSEEEIAEYLPRVRALFYAAGTVQAFARPFLARGVRIFSAWRENAVPVAEFAVSQILLANKGFFRACRMNRSAKAHAETHRLFSAYPGNFDCRVGLLGCGSIGRLVAEELRRHRLEVLVFDPFLTDEAASSLGVQKASLKEIFATCQTVSNHLANNERTKGMLDWSLFSKMPRNATFINTGRGAQVVEADLARALAVIVSSGRATISWVQRQLKVGYNRAARIIEELEERGCIGPANGTAPREILRTTLGPPPGSGDDDVTDGDDADGDGDFV